MIDARANACRAMAVGRQPITVRLTVAQARRCEKLATYLWPEEKLDVGEITRRLLLEHLLADFLKEYLNTHHPDISRGVIATESADLSVGERA